MVVTDARIELELVVVIVEGKDCILCQSRKTGYLEGPKIKYLHRKTRSVVCTEGLDFS